MSWLVIRWGLEEPWFQVRPDNAEERIFVRENGGEVMRVLESERLAELVATQLDAAQAHRGGEL